MKLSQSVTYAIHAVVRLAEHRNGPPISCGKLAEQGKMPERFLLQILRDLAKQGLLHSTRGGGGGFTLGRCPEDISLLEVLEAVDGPLSSTLPLKTSFEPIVGERLQTALDRITDLTRQQLQSIRISHLMPDPALPESHLLPAAVSA